MIEMRNKIMDYGDYNLKKELKDLENLLDRNRKNLKLFKKREEETLEKERRQIKSAKRIQNQEKIQVFIGRKPVERAPKPKILKDTEGKVVYNEHEADLNRYVYS
mmetsp:Transcript_9153/g.10325  ORF Transcript_9153/g.10325 Transcript_9153/m.10325 type:complete len:105 (-) Transcript_9153:2-316(-)